MGTGSQTELFFQMFYTVGSVVNCDPVETLSITTKQVQNLSKVYDFASCFFLNVDEYLIEWLCDLKADRNKQKIAGISNSVSKILYYTK